jgi:hypothetical protein
VFSERPGPVAVLIDGPVGMSDMQSIEELYVYLEILFNLPGSMILPFFCLL